MSDDKRNSERPCDRDELLERYYHEPALRYSFPGGKCEALPDEARDLLLYQSGCPIPLGLQQVPDGAMAERPQLHVSGLPSSRFPAVVEFKQPCIESIDGRPQIYWPTVDPTVERDAFSFDLALRETEGHRKFNLIVRRNAKAELASFFSDELRIADFPAAEDRVLRLASVLSYGEIETDWAQAEIVLRFVESVAARQT